MCGDLVGCFSLPFFFPPFNIIAGEARQTRDRRRIRKSGEPGRVYSTRFCSPHPATFPGALSSQGRINACVRERRPMRNR